MKKFVLIVACERQRDILFSVSLICEPFKRGYVS
jgi:hypothetical protein